MENKKQNVNQKYYLYTLMALGFVIIFFLMLNAQPSGTDWLRVGFRDRSISGFLNLMGQQYENVDGRVLGNLFSYLMMVPEWLRDSIKTLMIMGTIFVIWGMTNRKDSVAFIGTFLFFTAFSVPLLSQVILWNTGFFYQVFPVYFLLVYFLWMKMGQTDTERKREIPLAVFFFILGMASCLFMETLTLVFLPLSFLFLFYEKKGRDHISLESICWTAGTVIGTIILFSSPANSLEGLTVFANETGVASENFIRFYHNFRAASPFTNLPVFFVIMTGIVGRYQKNYTKLDLPMALICGVFFIYALLTKLVPLEFFQLNSSYIGDDPFMLHFDFFVHAAYFVYLIAFGFHGIENEVAKRSWFLILAGIFISFMINLFIHGPLAKDYYLMMILFILLAVLSFNEDIFGEIEFGRYLSAVALALIILFLVKRISPMIDNEELYNVNVLRIENTMDKGALEIQVRPYPYPEFVVDPDNSRMMNGFYYNEPEDLIIKVEE